MMAPSHPLTVSRATRLSKRVTLHIQGLDLVLSVCTHGLFSRILVMVPPSAFTLAFTLDRQRRQRRSKV